ncbi:hypothetical protein [Rhodopseudomonas parapalustris]
MRIGALVLSGAAVVILASLVTTIPYGRAIWDWLFLLDGAYRISLNQIPHVDFVSPIGSATLYLTAAAVRLWPNGNPFVGLHALAWLLMLPALVVLAPRFRSGLAFAGALGLSALMVLVPTTLDSTHLSEISYFASYNRFATALLFLGGLWLVLPKRRFDGLLLAYILTLLFFLKITTAIVMAGVVLAAVLLGRAPLRNLVSALVLTFAVLVAVNAMSGLVVGYFGDVLNMAAVNQGRALYAIFFAAFRNWEPLALVSGLVLVALWKAVSTERSLRGPFGVAAGFFTQEAFAVDACLLVAAALAAESQNTGGLGLIAATAVFFRADTWAGSTPRVVVSSLLLAAVTLPLVDTVVKRAFTEATRTREAVDGDELARLLPGTRVPRTTAEGARLFDHISRQWLEPARDIQRARFFIDPDPTSNASASRLFWAHSAVEAAKEFQARGYHELAHRYATLSFADPFALMLRLVPARGTSIAIEVGRTMQVLTEAGASRYLADADGVFVSRCEIDVNANEAVFGVVLKAEFERLPLHHCWDFYRRNMASPSMGS